MSTLHEIKSQPDGTVFRTIGPMDIFSQSPPKENKNGELYSRISAGNQFDNITIFLKGKMAMCRFPDNLKGVVLTGNFVKNDWNGTLLNCEEMEMPEGSTTCVEQDVIAKKPSPTLIGAMNAGIKGSEYVTKQAHPELAVAAFEVAAKAFLEGVPVK